METHTPVMRSMMQRNSKHLGVSKQTLTAKNHEQCSNWSWKIENIQDATLILDNINTYIREECEQ